MLVNLILLSLIGGVFSLIGGLGLLLARHLTGKVLIHLATFAAGALLGAAFLDLLPEGIEAFGKANLDPTFLGLTIVGGFISFFTLERILLRFHGHNESETHLVKTPWLLIIGDSLHNFLDGVAIAITYFVNPSVGLVTALAVAAHEVPSEIGEFSVMLQAGWPRRKIIFVNIVSGFMATIGAIFTYFSRSIIEPITPWALAVTVGVFLYIAAADLIPEIHHLTRKDRPSHVIALLVFGVLLVGMIGRLVE